MKKVKKVKQPKGVGGRVIAAFFAVVVFIALMVMWGDADAATWNWVVQYRAFGEEYDSLSYVVTNYDGTTRDSVYYTTDTTDTIALDQDSSYYAKVAAYDGTAWSDWGTIFIPRLTAGTLTLAGGGENVVTMLTVCGSDTLTGVNYTIQNTSGVYEASSKTGYPLDTVNLDDGTWAFIVTRAGYTGIAVDSAVTDNDTLVFTVSADGSLASPASPSLATVYGWLLDPSGSAIVGASVSVSRKGSVQMTDTTSAKNIISNVIDPVLTDTTGKFTFSLIRSNYYRRAADGVYEITATKGGQKIFDAVKVIVPDTGNLNLGDTLAARL